MESTVAYDPSVSLFVARATLRPGVVVSAAGHTPESASQNLQRELSKLARLQRGMDRGV